MRLTLRTLLAYLDDMLEEGDAQVLKTKIEESGIATALIARIRDSVDHREIGALSPDAIGPLENANVMSEYLDSTLSPEQIAEIERLCLDSDTSLSEAAACHQILTVVLGQPARVSDRLRQRVYQLPQSDELRAMEQRSEPAADAHTTKPTANLEPAAYSAVEIPPDAVDDETDLGAEHDELSSAANVGPASAGIADPATHQPTAIRPVGPDDSGVSNASTRLREAAVLDDDSGRSEAEIVAGTTREMMERGHGYGGSIRPSRITPWLVTLALVALVLYVLGQIFAPLSTRGVREVGPVAVDETNNGAAPLIAVQPKPTPPAAATNAASATKPVDPATQTPAEKTTAGTKTTDATPPAQPTTSPAVTEATEKTGTESAAVDVGAKSPVMDASVDVTPASTSEEADPEMVSPATGSEAEVTTPDATTPEVTTPDATTPEVTTPDATSDVAEAMKPDATKPAAADAAADAATVQPAVAKPPAAAPMVAELAKSGALVLVHDGENWSRLLARDPNAEAVVEKPAANSVSTTTRVLSGQTVVAPALFRPILVNQTGIEWTLAGPTRLKIEANDSNIPVTHLIDGRVLLASTQPNVTAALILGERQIKVAMPESQTVLAIELLHLRPPGANPLRAANRLPVYRVIALQGTATLQSSLAKNAPGANAPGANASQTATLETGQQFQGRGVQPAAVSTVDRLPPWIDAAAKKDVLVDSAREGLLEFVSKVDPIEKSLREAMAFRRVEVAALAAETLLLLGRADVYFGGDGILNRPRQRLYWEEHVNMLRQHIASDVDAAEAVRVAIERAEAADGNQLFKLLVGFTEEELVAGADEQLVASLDSPSMAVRVLAIENLRMIVGDTLAYRADQENANSRRNDIKKWETRFRRGDIRYKE